MSNVTAKVAKSFVAGQRQLLKAQRVELLRVNPSADTSKLDRAIDAMEYAEATLFAQRESGKSGMKAGVNAGFVPYADR